jgi:hypothetical protein
MWFVGGFFLGWAIGFYCYLNYDDKEVVRLTIENINLRKSVKTILSNQPTYTEQSDD